MEMHQVRYFLAVSRHLNFTRAAAECNVSQPSLTRAVKLLEEELGGELVRRERGLTHLTELGERMLPLLENCYESARSAKAIAAAMHSRKVGALRLALPHAVDIAPFLPHLCELLAAFDGLALRIHRGTAREVCQALREGHADLAICDPGEMHWERFESWPLFADPLRVAVPAGHRLAGRASVAAADLAGEVPVLRRYCDTDGRATRMLRAGGVDLGFALEAGSDRDALALVSCGAGLAVVPASTSPPAGVRMVALEDGEPGRRVAVFAVQGRRREAAAALLLTQLRAADWAGRLQPASSRAAPPADAPAAMRESA